MSERGSFAPASVAIRAFFVSVAVVVSFSSVAEAQVFPHHEPGDLIPGSGTGRVDQNVYVPGMRFPIANGPAYANSQVWGVGGSAGPAGGQCDGANYAYPWRDNYCETRQWDMPLCPGGQGHQGQDIRPSTCAKDVHSVVSAVDGKVTHIGSYSVYVTGNDGTRHEYLHMRGVAVGVGQQVARGQHLGMVSNNMGSTPTTIHLHYNILQNVAGVGLVYVPPYRSIIEAYKPLVTPLLEAELVSKGADLEPDPEGKADYRVCAGQDFHFFFEFRNKGLKSWVDWGEQGTDWGNAVRLGVESNGNDPVAGTARISVNENANVDVHPPSWSPPGPDCNDALHCQRTVFAKGAGKAAKAPSTPGVVTSTWRLVDEMRAWFGPSVSITYNVVACEPPASATATTSGSGSGDAATGATGGGDDGAFGGLAGGGGGDVGGGGAEDANGLVGLRGSVGCAIRAPGSSGPPAPREPSDPRRAATAALFALAAITAGARRRRGLRA